MASSRDHSDDDENQAWHNVRDATTGEAKWTNSNVDEAQKNTSLSAIESLFRADVRILFEIFLHAGTILKNFRKQVEANPGDHIPPERIGTLCNEETVLLFQFIISQVILKVKAAIVVPSKSEVFAYVNSRYPHADQLAFSIAYGRVKKALTAYCPTLSSKLES